MLHENVSLAGWQGRNIEGIEPVSISSWSSLMLVLRHALAHDEGIFNIILVGGRGVGGVTGRGTIERR